MICLTVQSSEPKYQHVSLCFYSLNSKTFSFPGLSVMYCQIYSKQPFNWLMEAPMELSVKGPN